MSKNPLQLEICFPSLDCPERGALRIADMGKLLNVSPDHIKRLLDDGTIGSGDVSRSGARQHLRVPREEWQRYLITTFGAFDRTKYISPLPSSVIREIINDCYAILRVRGEK